MVANDGAFGKPRLVRGGDSGYADLGLALPLARVLREDDLTGPRGPDGKLTITVPRAWLANGRWIELSLPRTLTCVRCEGGGCDGCGRSGAVDTRGRKELAEIVELRLPNSDQGATIRLPKRGGMALEEETSLDRGILLLTILPGVEASLGVRAMDTDLPDMDATLAAPPAPVVPLAMRAPPWWLWLAWAALLVSVLYALAR